MNHMLDPAILFFVFGVLAGTLKSNLEIPPAISRFLSLYLLMALGLKGGFALAASGLTPEVGKSLLAAIALALVVPWLALLMPHISVRVLPDITQSSASNTPQHRQAARAARALMLASTNAGTAGPSTR